ncbi:unnamed protein product [Oreochromis niloticus]|nr:unnamed protein product [Mustela putorius furo]
MTLAEEREMEIVRNGLTYSAGDDHSSEPHWHAKYPWVEDPATLPNNRKAVEATFIRTEMKLSKEPEWKTAYAAQVHEMVNRRAAVKLSKEVLQSWTGPVWYISHLIAPNPHSVSTPVRLVWNSSQKYRGLSLNDILIKGPDVLNPIRAVLLRFRVYAALGDIRKMYNSVWLEDREVHLHRFLWRDTEDAGIEDYAITRVNIGDKPAGCVAQVAMRETANLPSFSRFKEEKRVLEEDAYVDDILTSHNDLDHLRRLTANIEHILRAGGFYMKPWVYSSQSGREESKKELPRSEPKTMILPNQLMDDDNKALGLGYTINDDKLHKGAILVRRAFQEAKVKYCLEDTWDVALSEGLREDAIKLMEEYADLKQLHFTRALTPPDPCAEPSAITFSDGSEHAYGAVMYLRWSCSHSVIVRLVESKAKLTPLNHKGDPVKAEMCGAVFAARLKTYFQRHCRIQVKKWYHLVDSQTVLGAIQRDSYGFQTFANRVGEIQSSTDVQDWWWIPGSANIADILTRGASRNALTKDSEWQSGPKFLQLPEDEWLKKSAGEVAAQAREKVTKLQKKAFVAVLTRIRTKAAQDSAHVESRRPLAGVATQQLIDERRFSNLRRLIGTVAWVWRVAGKFMRSKTRNQEKWEVVPSSGVLTESLEEYSAKNETTWAWKILPADSPHRNGAAEAAVRVTKRALHTLGNAEALTFSEFLTALQLAANLANERPIDARIQSREDRIDYITPNNLLLGRATQSGDFKTIDFTNYSFERLKEVQTMVNNFWRSWSQLAGPNLFIRSKWHTAERNIAVGDIVWLCDQNALRGQFRLAKVISVNPDSRGIVRDVHVRVSPSSSIAVKSPKSATRSPELSTILHRDIRRLVVLLPVEDQARDQPT